MNPLPLSTTPALPIEVMPPLRLFFSPQGRIDRAMFWRGFLLLLLCALVMMALLTIAGLRAPQAAKLVNVVLLWPALCLSIKRWHDRDRSAWWVMVVLVPTIGGLWLLLDNGCRHGTASANRFGPVPAKDQSASNT